MMRHIVYLPFSIEFFFTLSLPMSRLCDWTGKTEVIGLSDLMTLFFDLGCLDCK
jgi:hypothetical protein